MQLSEKFPDTKKRSKDSTPAGSQSLQNNRQQSRVELAMPRLTPVMTAKFSTSSPACTGIEVNHMVNLPGTAKKMPSYPSRFTRTADTSSKRSHENSRDRTLSKSLSPSRSPKLSGLKNMIGANQMEAENSMPHLSLDVPKNISAQLPVACTLTSDDIQLEKQAGKGRRIHSTATPLSSSRVRLLRRRRAAQV